MSAPELIRTPPASIEAEQSVLGALLLDNTAWERIALTLTAKDFYRGAHRKIYEQIELLIETDQPADVVTVSQALQDAGILEEVGGPAYLAGLAQNVPSAINVKRYAELVKEKALLRNVIRVCSEIMELALTPGSDPQEALEEAERRIFELHNRRMEKQSPTFKQLLAKVFEQIDHRYHADSHEVTGLPTGYPAFDKMTAGLQDGDLIIIAGRPSMGKTSLAMNIAEYVLIEAKRPVAVFSIEMSDVQLVQRMLGSVGQVDQHKLRTGHLNDWDWSALTQAMEKLHGAPAFIEETTALTITELRARARRIARENPGLGLVIVDYLQLMASRGQTQSERTAEIGDISRGLKALAMELRIPVLALSQLNRQVEQRISKRPLMSDLRDSGSLEQDADMVVFIYRDIVYHESSDWGEYAEIIIGKQRNGPTGTVHLRFVKEMTRFENPGFDWHPPRRERKKKKGFEAAAEPEVKERADING